MGGSMVWLEVNYLSQSTLLLFLSSCVGTPKPQTDSRHSDTGGGSVDSSHGGEDGGSDSDHSDSGSGPGDDSTSPDDTGDALASTQLVPMLLQQPGDPTRVVSGLGLVTAW